MRGRVLYSTVRSTGLVQRVLGTEAQGEDGEGAETDFVRSRVSVQDCFDGSDPGDMGIPFIYLQAKERRTVHASGTRDRADLRE